MVKLLLLLQLQFEVVVEDEKRRRGKSVYANLKSNSRVPWERYYV